MRMGRLQCTIVRINIGGDSIETDLTLRITLVVFQLHLNHQEVQGFRKSPSHVIKTFAYH
jgi:hypothetical protein